MATKQTLNDKFQAVATDVNDSVLERQREISIILLALLTGEHAVFLGEPGVAKSLLIRLFAERIVDAEYFEKLLTQFTEPNEVFGPVDLNAYQNGQYTRISHKSLSTAHVGFLDEIFKANSAILNALLTIANERLLQEVGSDPVKCPLLSLFGASNETPQDESLGALYDRFCFRVFVKSVQQEDSFEKLLTRDFNSGVNATVSFDDIKAAQDEVKQVTITRETIAACKKLKHALSSEGIKVSDRKWVQIGRILQANAWLDGRTETDVEDLAVLVNVVWSDPKEIKATERTVYKVANPIHLRATEVEDQVHELVNSLPDEGDYRYKEQLENAVNAVYECIKAFVEEVNASKVRDKTRAVEAVNHCDRLRKELASKLVSRNRAYEGSIGELAL
jgi:MoxR-like ATPase